MPRRERTALHVARRRQQQQLPKAARPPRPPRPPPQRALLAARAAPGRGHSEVRSKLLLLIDASSLRSAGAERVVELARALVASLARPASSLVWGFRFFDARGGDGCTPSELDRAFGATSAAVVHFFREVNEPQLAALGAAVRDAQRRFAEWEQRRGAARSALLGSAPLHAYEIFQSSVDQVMTSFNWDDHGEEDYLVRSPARAGKPPANALVVLAPCPQTGAVLAQFRPQAGQRQDTEPGAEVERPQRVAAAFDFFAKHRERHDVALFWADTFADASAQDLPEATEALDRALAPHGGRCIRMLHAALPAAGGGLAELLSCSSGASSASAAQTRAGLGADLGTPSSAPSSASSWPSPILCRSASLTKRLGLCNSGTGVAGAAAASGSGTGCVAGGGASVVGALPQTWRVSLSMSTAKSEELEDEEELMVNAVLTEWGVTRTKRKSGAPATPSKREQRRAQREAPAAGDCAAAAADGLRLELLGSVRLARVPLAALVGSTPGSFLVLSAQDAGAASALEGLLEELWEEERGAWASLEEEEEEEEEGSSSSHWDSERCNALVLPLSRRAALVLPQGGDEGRRAIEAMLGSPDRLRAPPRLPPQGSNYDIASGLLPLPSREAAAAERGGGEQIADGRLLQAHWWWAVGGVARCPLPAEEADHRCGIAPADRTRLARAQLELDAALDQRPEAPVGSMERETTTTTKESPPPPTAAAAENRPAAAESLDDVFRRLVLRGGPRCASELGEALRLRRDERRSWSLLSSVAEEESAAAAAVGLDAGALRPEQRLRCLQLQVYLLLYAERRRKSVRDPLPRTARRALSRLTTRISFACSRAELAAFVRDQLGPRFAAKLPKTLAALRASFDLEEEAAAAATAAASQPPPLPPLLLRKSSSLGASCSSLSSNSSSVMGGQPAAAPSGLQEEEQQQEATRESGGGLRAALANSIKVDGVVERASRSAAKDPLVARTKRYSLNHFTASLGSASALLRQRKKPPALRPSPSLAAAAAAAEAGSSHHRALKRRRVAGGAARSPPVVEASPGAKRVASSSSSSSSSVVNDTPQRRVAETPQRGAAAGVIAASPCQPRHGVKRLFASPQRPGVGESPLQGVRGSPLQCVRATPNKEAAATVAAATPPPPLRARHVRRLS